MCVRSSAAEQAELEVDMKPAIMCRPIARAVGRTQSAVTPPHPYPLCRGDMDHDLFTHNPVRNTGFRRLSAGRRSRRLPPPGGP